MQKVVITSDIIHSSDMPVEHRIWLIERIEKILKELSKSPYFIESEMYRGDSFQCLLHHPKFALKAALIIKSYIKGLNPSEPKMIVDHAGNRQDVIFTRRMFDVRMSLAVGNVDTETGKIGTSNGEAFRLSGRKLDEMKKLKQSFSMTSDDIYAEELSTEAVLLNFILSKTTTLQCLVIYLKLGGMTEVEIAEELNIQQAAVNQRATSGGWHAIEAAVKRFENIYANG